MSYLFGSLPINSSAIISAKMHPGLYCYDDRDSEVKAKQNTCTANVYTFVAK